MDSLSLWLWLANVRLKPLDEFSRLVSFVLYLCARQKLQPLCLCVIIQLEEIILFMKSLYL